LNETNSVIIVFAGMIGGLGVETAGLVNKTGGRLRCDDTRWRVRCIECCSNICRRCEVMVMVMVVPTIDVRAFDAVCA
jgi:membrane protein implicated in regulation of membrane protease activity